MEVDISTSLCGIKMRSPLGATSYMPVQNKWFPKSPIEILQEKLYQKWLDNGVGFLKAPSVFANPFGPDYEPVPKTPLFRPTPGRYEYYMAAPTMCLFREDQLLSILEAIKELASKYEDVPVIGSVLGSSASPEHWADLAKKVEARGADLLEINTASPLQAAETAGTLPPDEAKWGGLIGVEPRMLGPIVEAVVKAVKIPVGVKLTADAGYPGVMRVMETCQNAGARYLEMFHMVLGIAPPDIYNGGKGRFLTTEDFNPIALLSGESNTHNMYKGAALSSMFFPKLEVFSGGGITRRENVIEAIMLGARVVETLVGIYFHGNSFFMRSLNFLKNYMEEQGYEKLDDFRGIAIQYIKPTDEVFEQVKGLEFVAETDLSMCSGCGLCADNVCPASYMESGIGMVDTEMCNGCGVCVMICEEGARRMLPRI